VSSHEAGWPFAFERICEALDLDPESVRGHVAGSRPVVQIPIRAFEALSVAEIA
jgi:hypothetical protein